MERFFFFLEHVLEFLEFTEMEIGGKQVKRETDRQKEEIYKVKLNR